jgi:hypothetical protein
MSRELIAAQSGWGKSWVCQQRIEANLERFDAVVILDYCDEYRGLAKAGLARWLGIGDTEAAMNAEMWVDLMEQNPRIVAARAVDAATWREDVAAMVAQAAYNFDGDVLVVVDEAHFVARMRKATPKTVEELATTGRGAGVASIWVTQRLAKLDATVSSQCDRKMLGGFISSNDIDRVDGIVQYPGKVHNPQLDTVRGLPDELLDGDGEPTTLSHTDPGSEWIYSTRSGEYDRIDSSKLTMQSTHYGPEGSTLDKPTHG